MINLNSTKGTVLEFEVQIQGIKIEELEASFRIKHDNMEIGFPVSIKERTMTVDIPAINEILKNRIKDGTSLNAKLEVIGQGFYTKAWEGDLSITTPIQVEATLKSSSGEYIESGTTLKLKGEESIKVKSVTEKKQTNSAIKQPTKQLKESNEQNIKEAVNKKVKDKLNIMESLIDSILSEKPSPKKEIVKPKKKMVQEKKKPTIVENKKITKDTIIEYMLSKGLRSERVQEHMLENAEMKATDPKDMKEVYEHVIQLLSTKPKLPDNSSIQESRLFHS